MSVGTMTLFKGENVCKTLIISNPVRCSEAKRAGIGTLARYGIRSGTPIKSNRYFFVSLPGLIGVLDRTPCLNMDAIPPTPDGVGGYEKSASFRRSRVPFSHAWRRRGYDKSEGVAEPPKSRKSIL